MKQCQKCKRVFEDSAFYCPECGEELMPYVQASQTTAQTTTGKKKSTVSALLEQAAEKSSEWDRSSNVLIRWQTTILGIIGILICWNLSVTWGTVIGVISGLYGYASQNKVNKFISISAAVICVMLTLLYMIL